MNDLVLNKFANELGSKEFSGSKGERLDIMNEGRVIVRKVQPMCRQSVPRPPCSCYPAWGLIRRRDGLL